ncbi:MAG: beta-ketoacyl-ACP synthase [Fibrobacterales bacterium]
MSKRVVITGGAAITPLGSDWNVIKEKLIAKENSIIRMNDWDKYKRLQTKLAAPAAWTPPKYSRKQTRGMGKVALMAVHTAESALEDAGLIGHSVLTGGLTGVSYGSSTGNVDALLDFYSMFSNNDLQGITATSYIKSMPQTCAVNIGIFFGLKGRLLTTNTACTAGSLSIGMGYEAIESGKQTVMVCGGAEELSPTGPAIFDTLFSASTANDAPKTSPRPFDIDRDGLVIGEGAGTVILEELEHARSRGAHIYAEIVGFGTNTDGAHITKPNKETMEIALKLALEDAQISQDKIDYVNGHGTATIHGDIAETQATSNTFKRKVPYSTLKSYIGHTLGACGAIESWLSIKMMNDNWIAPNLNLTNIDPECGDLEYIVGDGKEIVANYIMCNNFAFGGINTSLIFKRWNE